MDEETADEEWTAEESTDEGSEYEESASELTDTDDEVNTNKSSSPDSSSLLGTKVGLRTSSSPVTRMLGDDCD